MEFPRQCFGCVTAEAIFSEYNRYAGEEASALANKTTAELGYEQTTDPDLKARFSAEAAVAGDALRLAAQDRSRCEQSLLDKNNRCPGYGQGQGKGCGML